jgi:hypothetical protein
MQTERKYWFPAKRYGWGWGMPSTWQGWLVLAAFVVPVFAGSSLFPPGTELGRYLIYVAVLCGLLVGVCWLKGEPPHWRWGNDERARSAAAQRRKSATVACRFGHHLHNLRSTSGSRRSGNPTADGALGVLDR